MVNSIPRQPLTPIHDIAPNIISVGAVPHVPPAGAKKLMVILAFSQAEVTVYGTHYVHKYYDIYFTFLYGTNP